jgi:hypothetical protein
MEIIIRTDGTETVVHATEPGAAAAAATDVPAELAARAAAIGATNAGAAPTAPGTTGAPPVNITASQEQLAPSDAAGESAGAAPRDL